MEDTGIISVNIHTGCVIAELPKGSLSFTLQTLREAKNQMDRNNVSLTDRTILANMNALNSLFISTPGDHPDISQVTELLRGERDDFAGFTFKYDNIN